ncbi:MAG: hypothetical protein WBB31_05520 [Saprospiraceae bacterium]
MNKEQINICYDLVMIRLCFKIIAVWITLSTNQCFAQGTKNDDTPSVIKEYESGLSLEVKAKEMNAIEGLFNSYQKGIDNNTLNFEQKFALYSQEYFAYYKELIHQALHTQKQELLQLPISDIMDILRLRTKVSKEILLTDSVRIIMKWSSVEQPYSWPYNGKIQDIALLNDHVAHGTSKSYYYEHAVDFTKENGTWKINPFGTRPYAQMNDEVLLKKVNMSKEENVESRVKEKGYAETIWIPLVQ